MRELFQSLHAGATPSRASTASPRGESERPLSVLVVVPRPRSSGIFTCVAELTSDVWGDADHYRVICGPGAALGYLAERGIACQEVPQVSPRAPSAREVVAYAHAILGALVAEPADVIQCVSIRAAYAASLAILAQAIRRPRQREPAIVVSLQYRTPAPLSRLASLQLAQLVDVVTVGSREMQAALDQHGLSHSRVWVVASGEGQAITMREVFRDALAQHLGRIDAMVPYEC